MFELNLEQALLQKPPLRLLDKILQVDEKQAVCEAYITPDHPFYEIEIKGIYAWVGLELMAQAAGVFAYVRDPALVSIAFLMSVRQFDSSQPHFAVGSVLKVIASNQLLEQGVGVFDGQILQNEALLATARFSVYQPTPAQLQHLL